MNIRELYNRFCLRREDLIRLQGCDDSESVKAWDARLRENQWVIDFLKRHLQQKDSADIMCRCWLQPADQCPEWGSNGECLLKCR